MEEEAKSLSTEEFLQVLREEHKSIKEERTPEDSLQDPAQNESTLSK
jgi:hypothetical protein